MIVNDSIRRIWFKVTLWDELPEDELEHSGYRKTPTVSGPSTRHQKSDGVELPLFNFKVLLSLTWLTNFLSGV